MVRDESRMALSLSLGDILSKICRRCNIGRELRIIDW